MCGRAGKSGRQFDGRRVMRARATRAKVSGRFGPQSARRAIATEDGYVTRGGESRGRPASWRMGAARGRGGRLATCGDEAGAIRAGRAARAGGRARRCASLTSRGGLCDSRCAMIYGPTDCQRARSAHKPSFALAVASFLSAVLRPEVANGPAASEWSSQPASQFAGPS